MRKTISKEYQQLNVEHYHTKKFGVAGGKWAETVIRLLKETQSDTVLDYGAGKGILSGLLRDNGYTVTEYDPGLIEKSKKPAYNRKFDFIVSTDVFEHIEREYIDAVLDEIKDYMQIGGFFVICLGLAKKHWLSDGRNAHVLVRPRKWWIDRLSTRFEVREMRGRGWHSRELVVFVKPLKDE
jgi:2-polyprenyl-3-methyl-5-hydroxy-6-metoxy-1,4-benzoquinol methylase